jgi:hypothetical protein
MGLHLYHRRLIWIQNSEFSARSYITQTYHVRIINYDRHPLLFLHEDLEGRRFNHEIRRLDLKENDHLKFLDPHGSPAARRQGQKRSFLLDTVDASCTLAKLLAPLQVYYNDIYS